jgi:PAS domain S-box-containing protein
MFPLAGRGGRASHILPTSAVTPNLLGDMPTAAFTLDHTAHITSWSGDAVAWFGHPAAEALGRDCRFLFPDSELDVLAEAWTSAEAGENYSRVLPVRLRDGGRRNALLSCTPLAAPGGTGLLCQLSGLEQGSRSEVQMAFVDAVMQASPFGLGMLDTKLRYVLVNDALAEFNGVPGPDHIGRHVADMVRAADGGEYERRLRQVLETGEPLHNMLVDSRSRGHRDRDGAWSVSFFRLDAHDGQVLGLGGLIVDVTQKQTALLEASAVRQRLALVNQASSEVGTSLELAQTARELTKVVVPDFADAVTVELRKTLFDDGPFPSLDKPVTTVRLAASSALENPADRLLFSAGEGEHIHPVGSGSHRSLCTGRMWHDEKLDDGTIADVAHNAPGAPPATETELGSVIMAPLVARGRCLGLVSFGRSTRRAPLNDDDLKIVEELAARTALSLDNARLYDEERRVAVALQRNMLPDEKDIPHRPGLEIARHYWSSSRSANVGGDWFDVIPLSGHRVALVVGDTMGHDIHAAAGMGQLRTAMHTLARLDLEPVDLLTRLDDIVERSSAMQYATCVYAVYNTVTRECGIASAGHPAPMLRYADRTTQLIPVNPGVPLGVGLIGEKFAVTDLVLPPEGTLVLYTDGLIERRGEDIDVGIEGLLTALAEPAPTAQQLCDSVIDQLQDRMEDDDLAILMARALTMPDHRSARLRTPPQPQAASQARAWTRRTLREWGLEALEDTAQLLMSELVTNAVRHAGGDIELRLAKGGTLVVEVVDDDDRLPRPARATAADEWGRGLALVGEFAQDWGARSVTSGKVVWFELPLPGDDEIGPHQRPGG